MIEDVIASRYARALATAAVEKGEIADARRDMVLLVDILDPESGDITVPEFADFLATPTVSMADKIKATDRICEKLGIGKLVSDFLNVLIRHRRTALTVRISRYFLIIAAELEKVEEAFVQSAAPLSAAQEKRLGAALQKKLGTAVRLLCKVNPALVAGLRVKVGDIMLEGSVAGRLERLGAALA